MSESGLFAISITHHQTLSGTMAISLSLPCPSLSGRGLAGKARWQAKPRAYFLGLVNCGLMERMAGLEGRNGSSYIVNHKVGLRKKFLEAQTPGWNTGPLWIRERPSSSSPVHCSRIRQCRQVFTYC